MTQLLGEQITRWPRTSSRIESGSTSTKSPSGTLKLAATPTGERPQKGIGSRAVVASSQAHVSSRQRAILAAVGRRHHRLPGGRRERETHARLDTEQPVNRRDRGLVDLLVTGRCDELAARISQRKLP